jgi:hypothetical protein
VVVDPCTGLVPLAETSGLKIYPNPVRSTFMIESAQNGIVIIYNELGMIMLTQEIVAGTHSIDLSSVTGGIYIVKTISMDKVRISRLVKSE